MASCLLFSKDVCPSNFSVGLFYRNFFTLPYKYSEGDLLQILDKKGDIASAPFKKAKFSGDTLTLTIKGGGRIIFNDVNTSSQFNINGTTYKISGNSNSAR